MIKISQPFVGVHLVQQNVRKSNTVTILNLSDVHYDSRKCDRELLTKHLKQAESRGALVFINGDLFDLMQGKYDPRHGKYDIRPEYKSATYLDDVINDCAEYLAKFRVTYIIGQGNHETNIVKRLETNPIERVVERLKFMGQQAHMGWYSGLLCIRQGYESTEPNKGDLQTVRTTKIYYHHGSGGGSARSKGILSADIQQLSCPDADVITSGHDHNKWYLPVNVDRYRKNLEPYQTTVHHIRSGSYKLKDRNLGWEVEKGFRTPRLGGWWIDVAYVKSHGGSRVEITVTEAY